MLAINFENHGEQSILLYLKKYCLPVVGAKTNTKENSLVLQKNSKAKESSMEVNMLQLRIHYHLIYDMCNGVGCSIYGIKLVECITKMPNQGYNTGWYDTRLAFN